MAIATHRFLKIKLYNGSDQPPYIAMFHIYRMTHHLYGVLWWTGGHKCTNIFFFLY